MNEHKELLQAKLALFKMIDQFMYEVTDENGVEYFDDYCESAGEAAFSVLGFEDDRISKEEFYCKYDELVNELRKLNNIPYDSNYLKWYLEENAKKKLQSLQNYHSDIMLRIDGEDLKYLGFDKIPNIHDLQMAIYEAIAGEEWDK